MPYTPPSAAFVDNGAPVGGGLGLPLNAPFFNALVAGVDDVDTRTTVLENSLAKQKLFPIVSGDVAGAIAAITTAGAGVLHLPKGDTLTIIQTIVCPDEVIGFRIDGDLVVNANVTAVRRAGGATGTSTNITSPIAAGARTVSAVPGTLASGDCVFVVSADTLPAATDKLGYLRFVRSTTTSSVTFDVAIPRDMPDASRRFRPVRLAAPFEVFGTGTVRYANPTANTVPMLSFEFCRDLTIRDVELRDGGSRAIQMSHVVGFLIDARIDNFIDDIPNGHPGYGVDASGACRDGRVMGHISRCRHGFTTNVGAANPDFNFYGEPENIYVNPITSACNNKALDTHRAGWGITLVPNDTGSGGGVQIRADNVTVAPGSIHGSFVGAAVSVQAGLVVPPTIISPAITNYSGTTAIEILSDATLIAPTIEGFSNIAIQVAAGAGLHMPAGGRIAGRGAAGTTGVSIAGAGSRITGLRIADVALGVSELAGASDNSWDVEFTNCTTKQSRVDTYPQRGAALRGDAITAHNTTVGGWISPAAASVTTGTHGVAGTLTLVPIDLPDGTTIDRVAVEITTAAAGSSLRLGIYQSAADGTPGALLATFGPASAATIAVVEVPTAAVVVTGGRYWLAALSEGGNPSTRKAQTLSSSGATAADALSAMRGSYFAAGVTVGALPASAPALSPTATVTRVALRLT